jgi:hypothetical protein
MKEQLALYGSLKLTIWIKMSFFRQLKRSSRLIDQGQPAIFSPITAKGICQ